MLHRRSATLEFNAIRLVNGLLPAGLIEQITSHEAPGQKRTILIHSKDTSRIWDSR